MIPLSLEQFKDELIIRGLEEETALNYQKKMRQIVSFCQPLDDTEYKKFMIDLRTRGCEASSINSYTNVMRQYGFIAGIGWAQKLQWMKQKEVDKDIFSDEEIELMINCERPRYCDPIVWQRWSVWLSVLAFSGMRPNEAAKLTVDQVNWGTNNFILSKTKTKPRRVPIASNLQVLLKIYMKDKTNYLFPTNTSRGHIWRQGWVKHLNIRKKILGITRPKLTAHSFRHSFISNLWEEGAPLPDIMGIVGHSDPRTTLKYSHLGNKSAQRSINKHRIIQKNAPAHVILESFVQDAQRKGILNRDEFNWKITESSIYIALKEDL